MSELGSRFGLATGRYISRTDSIKGAATTRLAHTATAPTRVVPTRFVSRETALDVRGAGLEMEWIASKLTPFARLPIQTNANVPRVTRTSCSPFTLFPALIRHVA